MTSAQAKRYAILATVVTVALTSVKAARSGQTPPPQAIVGGFVVAIVLTVLADVAPQVAGPLALFVLVSSLVTAGDQPLAAISQITGRRQPAAPAAHPRAAFSPRARMEGL